MYSRNLYAVLRVPQDADPAAIRHAYRVLARRYHPDVGSGSSAQKFRDVTEAYEVLSDPQRRHDHDIDLERSRAGPIHVAPEPLIPEIPTYVPFRGLPVGFDEDIVRILLMFDDMFGQIW
jgi:curved DNA-binding protein CbpA